MAVFLRYNSIKGNENMLWQLFEEAVDEHHVKDGVFYAVFKVLAALKW